MTTQGLWRMDFGTQRTYRNQAATCCHKTIKQFVTWYHLASDRMGPQNRHEPKHLTSHARKCCPVCCPRLSSLVESVSLAYLVSLLLQPEGVCVAKCNMGLPTISNNHRLLWLDVARHETNIPKKTSNLKNMRPILPCAKRFMLER